MRLLHTTLPSLKSVQLYGYGLPLRRPLTTQTNSKHAARMRRGLLVALHSKQGDIGWGDIAPLPGLHAECMQQAKQQAICLLQQLLHHAAGAEGYEMYNAAAAASCVRWGIDTALAHLQQQQQPTILCSHVALNALVPPGDCRQMRAHAQQLLHAGHKCLKLKVGHLLPLAAAGLLQHIYRLSQCYGATIRLDMGQQWSLQQALLFGQHISPHWIEYAEEPLTNPQHIPQLHAHSGIWCALDDTLHKMPAKQWIALRGVRAWVVKPSLLPGGLPQCHKLQQQAHKRKIDLILSSCFDSSLGLRHLAYLAATLSPTPAAAGLLTSCWFSADVMPSLPVAKGMVHLPTLMQQLNRFDARHSPACRVLWQRD
ncbi:MAG: o-succinylbenzoate synthase [Myxococcota bacterium]